MSLPPPSRRQVLAEIVLIFAVFAIQGAWPVPDVNETHYLGKVIHFWNPDWLRGDFFMESPDTHKVFCYTFGWLSLWLPPAALAWTGRVLIWALLAWAWRRLSFAVVPRAWCSVLTAALFGCLMERCHMAGEWVIGGVEAKPLAYVFVFLGIEALRAQPLESGTHAVRGRGDVSRAGRRLGRRGRGHCVAVAPSPDGRAGTAITGRGFQMFRRPCDRSGRESWSGCCFRCRGLFRRLRSTGARIARRFERHTNLRLRAIAPSSDSDGHAARLHPSPDVALGVLAAAGSMEQTLCRCPMTGKHAVFHLRAFVAGAVAITLVGAVVNSLVFFDRALAANLLRYYWFRLSDVAVPLGVALEGVASSWQGWLHAPKQNSDNENSRGLTARGCKQSALAIAVSRLLDSGWRWRFSWRCFTSADHSLDRLTPACRGRIRVANFADWRAACKWVADSGKIPPGARFLVPRLAQTFKWYTGHSDVVNWKDVPQDAKTLLEWRRPHPRRSTRRACRKVRAGMIRWPWSARSGCESSGAKYDADYVITERTDPLVKLDVVYQNQHVCHLSAEIVQDGRIPAVDR